MPNILARLIGHTPGSLTGLRYIASVVAGHADVLINRSKQHIYPAIFINQTNMDYTTRDGNKQAAL